MPARPEAKPHLRWMCRTDMPRVLEIERASFEFPWTRQQFREFLARRDSIGMVTVDVPSDRITGFMLYSLDESTIDLASFAVAYEYRRQGIASAMLDKLKGKLHRERRHTLHALVRETNLPAQLFLKRQGLAAVMVLTTPFKEDQSDEDGYLFRYTVHDGARAARAPGQ